MVDFSHLHALETRLAYEQARLGASKTAKECAARCVTVRGIEREIADEKKFLGLDKIEAMSDDELLAELNTI